jgi:hypothetical protein
MNVSAFMPGRRREGTPAEDDELSAPGPEEVEGANKDQRKERKKEKKMKKEKKKKKEKAKEKEKEERTSKQKVKEKAGGGESAMQMVRNLVKPGRG